MTASIVIRAHNEAGRIERLLLGIEAQTVTPADVIVVDSGSTDDTVAIAEAHGAEIISVPKDQFTFGRALNRGCAAASGDVLAFVSAHAYPVHRTWLARLIAPFANDRVALSYGRQRGNSTNRFSEHQIFAQWFPPESVCPQPTHFCNNANCAVRRSSWESQRYDEALTGLEDLAWAKAIQERGSWIAYVAEAEVIHVHDEAWESVRNRYRREAMAMRVIDEHPRFTRADLVTLLARTVASDARAARREGVLRRELGSILRFRLNQMLGTYHGYNGPPELSARLRERLYYPGENGRARERAIDDRDLIDYGALESRAPAIPANGGNGDGRAREAAGGRVRDRSAPR